jgi:peptidoglycan/LPS O-acetylase OafA/YrhL
MFGCLERHNPYDDTFVEGRIPSLDGLRCVAVSCVLLAHGWFSLNLPNTFVSCRHALESLGVKSSSF